MRSLLPNSSDLRLFLLCLVLLGGCSGGDGIILPGDGEPADITVVDGDEQRGRVGEPLNEPLVVQVTDARGRPVQGATVAFELTSAGSEVVPDEKSTDADGLADARVVLGTTIGRQTGNARVVTPEGRPPVQADFSAMALSESANSMEAVAGQDQTGHVGVPLDDPLVVEVTDGFGNPVARVPITWTVEGGGSVSVALVETDEDGRARVERTLGPTIGRQTTIAMSEGLAGSPTTFVHTAVAGDASRLIIVSGNNQTAASGSPLPAPLVVRLVDAEGNGVDRTAVAWVVATGGGNATPDNSTTDSEGFASAQWTLGETLGHQRLDAVVSGVGVVSFSAINNTAVPTATTITSDSPDPSISGNTLTVAFRVTSTGPTPTGAVTVTVSDGPPTCTGTLSGGAGSCGLTLNGVGDRTLTATYSGGPGLSGSSDTEPHRVDPRPPQNEAPFADFNWHCEGLTCHFTDASSDPDGSITSRVWNFGDGTSTSGQLTPSHAYATAGVYLVTLTVTDNGGLSAVSDDNVAPQAQSLRIRRDPSGSADMGVPFQRQPELELRAGGRDLEQAGVVITASIASGAGTLGGTTTATTDDQGRAAFTDLSISGAAGPHTLRFTASGFGEVVSSTIEVRRAGSTTTITGDSPDPSETGTAFLVEFQVAGAGPTPTGSVTVTVSDGSPTCTTTLSGGAGSCELTLNNLGDRTLTATYSGDGFYEGSSGHAPHSVSEPPPPPPPPNQPPDAADDAYLTLGGGLPLTVDAAQGVLSNDRDPEGLPLSAQNPSDPAQGAVQLSNDGSFTYTPDASATGQDSFTYQASDGSLTSTATVTITITP